MGEHVRGDGVGGFDLDVGGELDVGAADEDMVDVDFVLGAVEVEGHFAGLVGGVEVAGFQGAVFEDGGYGNRDVLEGMKTVLPRIRGGLKAEVKESRGGGRGLLLLRAVLDLDVDFEGFLVGGQVSEVLFGSSREDECC